jgi:hypothetical protein
MTDQDQKELWRKEKEQLLRDKMNQSREVRRREVPLSMDGTKKATNRRDGFKPVSTVGSAAADELLRKRLGL